MKHINRCGHPGEGVCVECVERERERLLSVMRSMASQLHHTARNAFDRQAAEWADSVIAKAEGYA